MLFTVPLHDDAVDKGNTVPIYIYLEITGRMLTLFTCMVVISCNVSNATDVEDVNTKKCCTHLHQRKPNQNKTKQKWQWQRAIDYLTRINVTSDRE